MPEYQYLALARDGKEVGGREFADSTEVLRQILKKRRLILVKAKSESQKRVSPARIEQLISDLGDLLDSGVVLERALQIISSDNADPKLASLAVRLRNELKAGHSLSQSVQRLGNVNPLLAPMLHAGEVSGQLAAIVLRMSEYFGERRTLRKEIAANLAYPAILMVVSILSLVGLAVYVVPVFRDLFEDDLEALPLGTRIVFAASDWVMAYGMYAVIAISLVILTAAGMVRFNQYFRFMLDRLLLSMPLFGQIMSLREAANFTSVLGILLNSGIPLVQAMDITRSISLNRYFKAGVERATRRLRQGGGLTTAVHEIPGLPKLAQRLITIGDEGGSLAKACNKAARLQEKDLKLKIHALVSMMEPVIILTMGGVVGFVVVSMLLAVFGLTDLAGG